MNKLERIQRLLNELQYAIEQGIPVIVEGKRDREALQQLGVSGKIFTLSTNSLSEIAERIAGSGARRAIILTDFDRRGMILAKRLNDFFLNEAVNPDLGFRSKLRRLTGFRQLEELPPLILRIEEELVKERKN
jgi:5S rRNA maturation endonuclease (ribonuclease M5)